MLIYLYNINKKGSNMEDTGGANIQKLILWYRCGFISAQEFLKQIDTIDSIEIPYKINKLKEGVTNVR